MLNLIEDYLKYTEID